MRKEVIEKIIEMSGDQKFEVDGRTYSRQQIHAVKPPTCEPIQVNTLTAIVNYVKANQDDLDADSLILHVESFDSVKLLSAIGDQWMNRHKFIEATRDHYGEGFTFGRFIDAENFNIQLQSRFERTEQSKAVLKIVGNLRSENANTHADDGVTQTVVARNGIALNTEVDVPNPVTLKPFRTFVEIDQPESSFILRVKNGRDGEPPGCALFEADGGAWKLTAIKLIADFFREQLPNVTVIA